MPNNLFQQEIVRLSQDVLELSHPKDKEVEECIKYISTSMGVNFNSDPDSNMAKLVRPILNKVFDYKKLLLNFVAGLSAFFDTHKFNDYASGTYAGLRSALISLAIFTDVKIEVNSPGVAHIVVRFKPHVKEAEVLENIFKTIHRYISVGISTFIREDEPGLIKGSVNASTGQACTYGFFKVLERPFKVALQYKVDYEDPNMTYDMERAIHTKVEEIISSQYNSIGKDIKIQDFYAPVLAIPGLGHLKVSFQELDPQDPNHVIRSFDDVDVLVQPKEIVLFKSVEVKAY